MKKDVYCSCEYSGQGEYVDICKLHRPIKEKVEKAKQKGRKEVLRYQNKLIKEGESFKNAFHLTWFKFEKANEKG